MSAAAAGRAVWFDAHCHLQDPRNASRTARIVGDAADAGVQWMVCNGTHEGDWDAVAAIAAAHPCVIPSFGLHPWYIDSRSPHWLQHLEQRLSAHPHAAMGEHSTSPPPSPLNLSVSFPPRLLPSSQNGPFPAGVVLHSFNGPPEMLPALTSLNAFFSFSRLSASSPPHKLAHLLRQVPLDRLLLETDSPDGLPPARRKGEGGRTGKGGGGEEKAGKGGREGCRRRESHSEAQQRGESGGGERCGMEGERGEGGGEERGQERGMEGGGERDEERAERGSGEAEEEGRGEVEGSGDDSGLNSPATIGLVCEMVASSMGRSKKEVAEAAFANAVRLFSYPGSNLSSLKRPKIK
ncbi:unnamed protein product [Closterium sp. Yama58-4]|nr:unnamed protein product [Closterium sp. Yama58-4]